ncbi:LuxR C-terminal-related transcriptional regulator [Streptomyces sp. NPDC059740]|uniref:response regulator transcription factor n=1 Tax=Streptomyces sp. NPDC059740 TaxID=3346926 RepID=UPI00365244CB
MVIRVLLVHELGLYRDALVEVLARERDLRVEAATAAGAPEALVRLRPDVVVVDADSATEGVAGPHHTGFATATSSPAADTARVGLPPGSGPAQLVLGSSERPGPLRLAYEAGARGFVGKGSSPRVLAEGIRQVAQGRRHVDPALGFGFLQAADMPLTGREVKVLSLLAQGATVPEIAALLHLSAGTVRNYVSAITRKTGARNRIDAIRISRGAGWL